MQTIYRTQLSPEQYAEQNHHKQVSRPELCGHCGKAHVLEGLGFYARYITTWSAAVLLILVRRFVCLSCGRTTSCLPEFALPYRLVNSETVTDGFNERESPPVARWSGPIQRYWRDFNVFLDELLRTVGNAFGPLPLRPSASFFWKMLLDRFRSLGAAMEELVHHFGITLYARYRCHQRPALHAA